MSDFLFSSRRREPGELRAHLKRFLAPVTASFDELHGAWGSLAVARASFDPPVFVDAGASISVLAGDPVMRSASHGMGLVTSSTQRRQELHDLLSADGLVVWDNELDGHFALLAIDVDGGTGRIVTDAFAFVPVFHGTERDGGGLVVGTHVDAVARACGRVRDVDPVSAADLVANLTCTVPHTLYDGVFQVDAGTDRHFTSRGWLDEGWTYWRPVEERRFGDVGEAAEVLRNGLRESLTAACGGAGDAGLLMSGGEDSRAVLGAMPDGVYVEALTYAEWESREVRVARAAAARYGAALAVAERGPSHYLDGFEPVAGIVGSHHLFTDVHGYGLSDAFGLDRLPLVIGGLSADSLLKARYERRRNGAPVEVPAVDGIDPELLREVARRRTAFRDRLAEIRPRSADEWDTLWPMSMRKHGGNVDGNRRLFRSWEAFHATAVLRVAAAAPVEWKRHRRLFLRAMKPLLRPSWDVPHAEYRFPYFGRLGNAALFPILAVARGARAVSKGEVRARHRPWPKWTRLADAAAARRPLLDAPPWASPLGAIFADVDPAAREEAVGGWHALSRLMLVQLAYVSTRAGTS